MIETKIKPKLMLYCVYYFLAYDLKNKRQIKHKTFKNNQEIKCHGMVYNPLREKCPNTEFFLVRIFLYSD